MNFPLSDYSLDEINAELGGKIEPWLTAAAAAIIQGNTSDKGGGGGRRTARKLKCVGL